MANLDSWLARADAAGPAAIVLGASVNGLSFARSLGRRGVPVLMLDHERRVGMYTRHAKSLVLPSADDEPDAWIDLLSRVAGRLDRPSVLFATSDPHVLLLARHAERLLPHARFLVPELDVVERIVNKRAQYAAAQAAGVPIPATHFPDSSADARRVVDRMTYPCILKPYTAHVGVKRLGKKVALVRSPGELLEQYDRLAGDGVPVMVQEIVPGGDEDLYGYLAFWDEEGRERAWLTKRKLRQNPPLYGDGSLQVTADAPQVAELSRRLLGALGYRGFVGVEFKYDARDGTFRLMEINARTVSGNQMAISAGVDFPWIGYRHLTQGSAEPVPDFECGVKYVNEEWDFKAFLDLRRAGSLTLREWLRSRRGVRARAIGAVDDPRPLMAVGWRFARAFVRDALRPILRSRASPRRTGGDSVRRPRESESRP